MSLKLFFRSLLTATAILFCFSLSVPITRAQDKPPLWWPDVKKKADRHGYDLIAPGRLQTWIDNRTDFLLVDVRPSYEYRQGHLPGAVNFEIDQGDLRDLAPEKKDGYRSLLGPDPDRSIVVYCRNFW